MKTTIFSFFVFLLLPSCQPEPRNAVPADDTYIYSGTFRAIQEPFILVDGTEYPNQIGEAPIQITAEVHNDNLVFTIYGKDYGIYDVNFFVQHADCFEYNGSELLDERPTFSASKINSRGLFKGENCKAGGRRVDERGNEEIRILFNEDYWKKCYFDNDEEKIVSFVLKSEKPIFG